MERVIEEITSLKFEKLAEVKASYDIMLKMLKPADEKSSENCSTRTALMSITDPAKHTWPDFSGFLVFLAFLRFLFVIILLFFLLTQKGPDN